MEGPVGKKKRRKILFQIAATLQLVLVAGLPFFKENFSGFIKSVGLMNLKRRNPLKWV